MNHPVNHDYTNETRQSQSSDIQNYHNRNSQNIISQLKATLDTLADKEFCRAIQNTRRQVQAGFMAEAMWKAYLLSFILNMDCTNDLIRKLEENPSLALICGFNMDQPLPSRWAFDRFISNLSQHTEIIQKLIDKVIDQLHDKLPEFGMTIAIDSTPVKSHSNPNKRVISDPQAGFIAKEGIDHKVWKWGYKLHLAVDANWELPIQGYVTLAKESDTVNLIPLIEASKEKHPWFEPWHVIADKGYDAGYNFKAIHDMGAAPIIKMKGKAKKDVQYTIDEFGIPHCMADRPLHLRWHETNRGNRYACPCKVTKEKCPLAGQCSLKVVWISDNWEYRHQSAIPQESTEWNEIYDKRSAAERVNSRLKGQRRLNSHCHRGLEKIRIHSLMSVLALVVTALIEANNGHLENVRLCTRQLV